MKHSFPLPLRPRRMYAPCGPHELHGSHGMDVWVKPEVGRRKPVMVIPLSKDNEILVNEITREIIRSVFAGGYFEEDAKKVKTAAINALKTLGFPIRK